MGFLKSKLFRQLLVVIIILLTFGTFVWYGATHPKIISTVLGLNPVIIIFLTLAYSLTILANGVILHFSLAYVQRKTSIFDNILLTGYSSIVNFFGPLQSGPGFRAVYLKKKYGIEIKRFLLATFVFYLFFGAINLTIVLIAGIVEKPDWRPAIIISIVTAAILAYPLLRLASKKERFKTLISSMRLKDGNFWLIGAGALGLTLSSGLAYFIELTEIAGHINIGQVLVYTATANLSLFVSLTPGAIGFREAFLVFSQQLHSISTNVIFAASVVDRAFYVAFLLVMFIVLLAINGHKKFLPSLKRSNRQRQ
jgi:uncharacterized membrane protein YbhN (UPF0104 family)